MRLYDYWRSSSAWRVRIALAYKRVAYQLVPVHLLRDGGAQHRAEFRAVNPLGQVPVLEIPDPGGPIALTQSMAILEYLEETYPDPPLLSRSRELRARARELAEIVNSGIQPLQNLATQRALKERGVDPAPFVKAHIETGLSALERLAEVSVGRYLVGDEPSFADVYLVPELYVARRQGVDVEAFATLRRVELACEALEAFRVAHPDAQPDRDPDA